MVSYLKHEAIDKLKWNHCIAHAANGLIYASSLYLDIMADHWDAVIVNDYEAVMPLVWRKKYFTRYLYQPPFTQQLGVFFTNPLSSETYAAIENEITGHFNFAEIFLNHGNNNCFEPRRCKEHINFVLNINQPYDNIHESYLPGFTKSLRRVTKNNFEYKKSDNIDEVITLYQQLYGSRVTHLTGKDFTAFKKLCSALQQQDQLVIREAVDGNGALLATVLLFKDEKRLYNVISCVTDDGKRKEVNYFLYDSIIHEFCSSGLLLDLEGSDIKGVADFYMKMNPVNQPYSFYRFNHLHPLMRLLKK